MNIIIPIGGKSERFKGLYNDTSKQYIKIFDKCMLNYVLDNINTGPDDKIFIISYNLDKDKFSKYDIHFIQLANQTRGAAETILYGCEKIKLISQNKKCVLLDCDTFYTKDFLSLYRELDTNACFYTEDTQDKPIFSYIKTDSNENIIEIIEKVKISNKANTGIYCFSNIEELQKYAKYVIDNNIGIGMKNECYTSCIISEMIKDNKPFKAIQLSADRIFNLGTPEQLNEYISNTYLFLFDLDGTLVLSDDIYFNIWSIILKKYNITLDNEIFTTFIQGHNDNYVLKTLLPNIDINISELKDTLFLQNMSNIKIIDGSIDFLIEIKKRGFKIAIVTNCNRIVAENILEYTKINKLIDLLVIGNECSYPKPHPEPYLFAMRHFNFDNKKTMIFEDSKTGIASAINSYPKCVIGIETLYESSILKSYGVNFSIKNYDNLAIEPFLKYNNIMDLNVIKKYVLNSITNMDLTKIQIDGTLKGGFISDVYAVKITSSTSEEYDTVLKLENKNGDTFLSKMAKKLNLYDREYYFYDYISKYIPIKYPKCYGLIKDDNYDNIGILMDNLNSKNYKLNLNINVENMDVSLNIINNLAKMHSCFWNKDLNKMFKELNKNDDPLFNPTWSNFIKERWDLFKTNWTNIITEQQMSKAETIMNNFSNIQRLLSDKNLTLCHGDVKSPNIFYKPIENGSYEPYFIDWQYVCIGKGVQDLVFFMIESFSIDKLNLYFDMFKKYYYIKLLEYGVNNYSLNDYEIDFKNAACYFPFFVALWFGTLSEDELIDKNFPYFFIVRLFNFLDHIDF
jgi:HAD superfamily hydrolase (TIGR01509 family)